MAQFGAEFPIKAANEQTGLRIDAGGLGYSTAKLASWFSTYLEQGLAGLVEEKGRKRAERLPSEQRAQHMEWLEEKSRRTSF